MGTGMELARRAVDFFRESIGEAIGRSSHGRDETGVDSAGDGPGIVREKVQAGRLGLLHLQVQRGTCDQTLASCKRLDPTGWRARFRGDPFIPIQNFSLPSTTTASSAKK